MKLTFHVIAIFVATVVFAGCSTTNPIVTEWRNPGYSAASFKRIMVGGLGGATSVRRNFEDEFVTQLRAAGIDALPSYRSMAEDDKVDEAKIRQAAEKAGADAAILTRPIHVEEKTQLGPGIFRFPGLASTVRMAVPVGTAVTARRASIVTMSLPRRRRSTISARTKLSGPLRLERPSRRTSKRRSKPM